MIRLLLNELVFDQIFYYILAYKNMWDGTKMKEPSLSQRKLKAGRVRVSPMEHL